MIGYVSLCEHRQHWVWQWRGRRLGIISRKSFPKRLRRYEVRKRPCCASKVGRKSVVEGSILGHARGRVGERDPLSSCTFGNHISTVSQRTESTVTQVLLGSHSLGDSSAILNVEQAEIMPCGSWKECEMESEKKKAGAKVSGLKPQLGEAQGLPWIPGFQHQIWSCVALTCSGLKQGFLSWPEIEVGSPQLRVLNPSH